MPRSIFVLTTVDPSMLPAFTGDVTKPAGSTVQTAAETQPNIATLSRAAGVAVHGTNTNDAAAAGYVGELVTATGSLVSAAASGNYGDVTSISLTAGDWDVSCIIYFEANGATVTSANFGIGTATGNSATGIVAGSNMTYLATPVVANPDVGGAIPPFRVSLSATTTYYFKLRSTYTVATPRATGRLSARRVR